MSTVIDREALGGCGGCHACCTIVGEPPFGTMAAINALPTSIRDELKAHLASIAGKASRGLRKLVCLWLVKGLCKYYELRPLVCRNFQVGGGRDELGRPGCLQFIQLGIGVPDGYWPKDPR